MSRWTSNDLAQRIADNPGLRIKRDLSPSTVDSHKDRQKQEKPAARVNPPQGAPIQPLAFTVVGSPVPKPRQTRSDKWKKRPCVVRYREWADSARLEAKRALGRQLKGPGLMSYSRIKIVAFLPIPESWRKQRKAEMRGKPHQSKPDADNLAKASCDALYPAYDEHLYDVQITKRWDDGNGARTVITLW